MSFRTGWNRTDDAGDNSSGRHSPDHCEGHPCTTQLDCVIALVMAAWPCEPHARAHGDPETDRQGEYTFTKAGLHCQGQPRARNAQAHDQGCAAVPDACSHDRYIGTYRKELSNSHLRGSRDTPEHWPTRFVL
jgi:hypothetical protein